MRLIENIVDSFSNNLLVENRYQMILDGLQVTLLITLFATVLGTLLGGLVHENIVFGLLILRKF